MAKNISATLLISMLLMTMSNALSADQRVTASDGREVLLKQDGSWLYLSTDRFANTGDGRQVRLKEDGSWTYDGNVPLRSKTQVRTVALDIKLQKVVVETYKKKTQKSTRIKTQTVFYVLLNNSAHTKQTISIQDSDISLLQVKDSNGKDYPVLSIKPGMANIPPGEKTTLVIRAEKSPLLFDNVKSMAIIFKRGIFGIEKSLTLSQRKADFGEANVDGFK